MNRCAIIVPVYKDKLDKFEIESFSQLLKILNKYPIILITHKALNTEVYQKLSDSANKEIQFQYFDELYFKTLLGYNSLCLNKKLYATFSEYKYILIYQLDAYVFSDELESWLNKGYDYIGAPWFEENKSFEEGTKLWAVGNGGFSLRKISTFINLFESKQSAYGFKYLYKKAVREKKGFKWLLKTWVFNYENNFKHLLGNWDDAEDLFYCLKLSDTNYRLKIPEVNIAIDFAFEQSPSFLFQQNKNKLPFGCHAWNRYETESFWSRFIDLNRYEG